MERCLCYVTLCLLGLGLLETNAFEVEIKDDSNKTCIYAQMKVSFIVEYETNNGTVRNVTFEAPNNVTTEGSSCESQLLNVHFDNGHIWSLNFTKDAEEYRGSVLSFSYNTNDSTSFPDAKPKGLLKSSTTTGIFVPIPLNAAYKCLHEDPVITENVVHLYLNVTLQAFMEGSTLGRDFHCSADRFTTPSPTVQNTTIPSTTAPPKPTSKPTSQPIPTSTTKPTPKPTPKPVDKPDVGKYFVLNGKEKCLLASMGLQLNASILVEGKSVWTALNINPNNTASSGTCGNQTAFLRLSDNTTSTVVEFHFFIKEKTFHLQEVNVTLINGSGIASKTNVNLSLWEASLNNSYLCNKEQLITVTEDLYINTFELRVQPFNVKNGTYSTAHECHLDDDSILIPIIVGAALSGLIVIIVIAYLIGRRKTYAGYQTL